MVTDADIANFLQLLKVKIAPGMLGGGQLITTSGAKFIKVLVERNMDDCSVYAFIEKATGDIFKPASWAAPAKHARGNIFDADPVACCNLYSVAYLR